MLDMGVLAEEIAVIVAEETARALAPVKAENETLKARIETLERRAPEKGEPGEPGKDGRDGKDGEPGQNGKDGIDGKDGVGLPGEKGADGRDGIDGKDGAGIADLMIDRDHSLVATFTDGRIKSLGRVVGANGKDGRDGDRGSDGLGFDDMTIEQDGERSFVMRFERGDQRKEFRFALPVLIDRGVYQAGKAYDAGDAVTWGGSLWIAKQATDTKPDGGDAWRLAVKRGRDGKDAAK